MSVQTVEQWYHNPVYLEVNGRRIFYRDEGAGEAIVFLHGFPTCSYDWYKTWPGLVNKYRCVALDFLGFGYSDKPVKHTYSIHEQADIADALIDHLQLSRFKLIAHDYGDTVAQEVLARQKEGAPYSIQSVILLNGGLFSETHRARLVQKLLLSPLGPLLGRLFSFRSFAHSFSAVFGRHTRPGNDELQDLWRLITYPGRIKIPHKLIHYMKDRRLHRQRWVDALRNQIPTRLINGPDDPVSGAHLVERYRQVVDEEADVVFLPGIGHYPQLEDPAGTLEAILSFETGGYS